MPKKPKTEKPAAADKVLSRRSESAIPKPSKRKKRTYSCRPQASSTGPETDKIKACEDVAASPGRAIKTSATTLAATTAVGGDTPANEGLSSTQEPELSGAPAIDAASVVAEQLRPRDASPRLVTPGSSGATTTLGGQTPAKEELSSVLEPELPEARPTIGATHVVVEQLSPRNAPPLLATPGSSSTTATVGGETLAKEKLSSSPEPELPGARPTTNAASVVVEQLSPRNAPPLLATPGSSSTTATVGGETLAKEKLSSSPEPELPGARTTTNAASVVVEQLSPRNAPPLLATPGSSSTTVTVGGDTLAKEKLSSSPEPELPGARPTTNAASVVVEQLSPRDASPLLATPGISDACSPVSARESRSPASEPVKKWRERLQAHVSPSSLTRAKSPVWTFGEFRRAKAKSQASPIASPATQAIRRGSTAARSPAVYLATAERGARRRRMAVALVATAVAIIVTCAILVLALATETRHTRVNKPHCDSEDCLSHADVLTLKLNQSIDPCEHFSAYVCSAWAPSDEYKEHIKTPLDAMQYYRYVGFGKMLAIGAKNVALGKKALAMYESCMRLENKDEINMDNFRRLMEAVGLSWPEQPADNASALGTLLSMAYKWQMSLWMSATVPLMIDPARLRLQIKPGHYLPILRNHYVSVTSEGGYIKNWKGYYNVFSTNSTLPIDDSSIEAVADAEGAILESLRNSYISRKKIPAVIYLASIGNYTAPLSSDAWLEQMNVGLELTPPALPDHLIITSDTGFLAKVGDLFANYSSQWLLSQMAWAFVQLFAPISNPELKVVRFGNHWKADVYRPIICAFHVEDTYKELVPVLEYVSRLTQQDQDIVNMGYRSLISALHGMLENSTWLDMESKKPAALKVAATQMLLWPTTSFSVSNGSLEKLYSDYPVKKESFADYWVNARFAVAKHNSKGKFEAARVQPTYVSPYTEYDYVLNRLEIPILLVNVPLYYRSGTKAMFYGGLGFQMALRILSALDKEGLRWNGDGQHVPSIFSRSSMEVFDAKDHCLREEGIESIFPEVPALEVAYSAMMRAIQSDKKTHHIEDLPEEKVFFMTMCYMMCGSPTTQGSISTCDKVVRNFPAFQDTFKCRKGAKMNPEKKCTFFT